MCALFSLMVHVFVILVPIVILQDFEDSLMHGSQITVSMLQRWLYYGQISGNENIYRHILSQTIFRPRRNPYFVLSETNPLRVIDSVAYGKDVAGVKHIDHSDETVVTVWLVGDMNNKNVAATAAEAVAFVEKTPRARLAVFHVGTDRFEVDTDTDWSAVVRQSDDIPTSVKSLFSSTGYTIVANGRVIGPIQESFKMVMSDYQQLFDAELSRFKGLPVLLSDIKRTPDVTLADAHAIAASTLLSLAVRHTQSGELVELGTRAETIKRSTAYHGIRAEHASFEEGDRSAPVHIVAILDPLSKMTQRVAPILDELSRMRKIFHVKIIFNPTAAVDADDLPLKRFYRYAIATELRFNGRGQMRKPKVVFEGVPVEPLLTLGMDVIQPWVVAPKVSPYDLDNIRLSDLSGNAAESVRGISADFLLQHILVEGHCRDKRTHSPPSGLQFELMAAGSGDDEQRSTSNGTVHQDTIVMANLGYYQLKTNPGVWQMMMRKGRSRELYDFVDVVSGGTTIPSRDGVRVDVAVTSFSGALLYTRVKKRAGKEKEDLLMDDDNVTSNKPAEANTGGMLENLLGWAGVKSDDDKAAVVNPDSIRHADINIFSVASGHLYERFLRIMIVSVLKHTKSTVKFWFIENFLSPSFKVCVRWRGMPMHA